MKLPASLQQPKTLFTLAITLYVIALGQNILAPVGNFNIVLTALLSFLGSLALTVGIMLPRMQAKPNTKNNKHKK